MDIINLRALAHSVIDSYEFRVKTIGTFMQQASDAVGSLRADQENMLLHLRDVLAKSECLRKKDFDTMTEGLRGHQREREAEVARILDRFQREEQEMVAVLRRVLDEGERAKPEDLVALKADILVRQKEREQQVAEILREFHAEQEELRAGLQKLLSKGDSVKIRDLKALIRATQIQYQTRNTQVSWMLKAFDVVREDVNAQWQKVVGATMRNRGFTAAPVAGPIRAESHRGKEG